MKIKLTPNLRVLIAQKNIKQKELAEIIGVDPFSVSRWVNGAAIPPLETAYKLAIILECKVDDLWLPEKIED